MTGQSGNGMPSASVLWNALFSDVVSLHVHIGIAAVDSTTLEPSQRTASHRRNV